MQYTIDLMNQQDKFKQCALYARGLSTREIHGHLKEIYDIDVSPELISHVTNALITPNCLIHKSQYQAASSLFLQSPIFSY